MSLFRNPTEHAENPPESWQAVKVTDGAWRLTTAGGGVLDQYGTRREAEAARTSGFLVDLYARETRWYAGETIPGWRPYADVVSR